MHVDGDHLPITGIIGTFIVVFFVSILYPVLYFRLAWCVQRRKVMTRNLPPDRATARAIEPDHGVLGGGPGYYQRGPNVILYQSEMMPHIGVLRSAAMIVVSIAHR